MTYLPATSLPGLLTVRVGGEIMPWIGPIEAEAGGAWYECTYDGPVRDGLHGVSPLAPRTIDRIRLDLRRPEAFAHALERLVVAHGADEASFVRGTAFARREHPGDGCWCTWVCYAGWRPNDFAWDFAMGHTFKEGISDPVEALLAACLRVGRS